MYCCAYTYDLGRVFNFRIAVCDDETFFLDSLKEAVSAYSSMNRLEIAIDAFLCGEALLDSTVCYDMVFMDYKMDGIDGLEAARALRKKNLNCTIIFMTSYPHFIRESFEVGTFRFFRKPLDTEKLYKALDDYCDLYGNNYPILLRIEKDTVCVHTNDIVYLEADNKACYVHLADKKMHCPSTMATVAQHLPMNIFFKVSKAFYVNFNYIADYDDTRVFLKNGASVFVSRKNFVPFKNAYKNYARNRNF